MENDYIKDNCEVSGLVGFACRESGQCYLRLNLKDRKKGDPIPKEGDVPEGCADQVRLIEDIRKVREQKTGNG